ncbi:alpha/beta fold hydrolase [Actinoallomurus sp. NPDC050550]|uniref:alpha/beta fold hydrolase n=1 Tax=Actinoallomurus sp. NPDC050550 TaxID=3154937 RepID=UPI0034086893
MTQLYADAPVKTVSAGNGIEYAYREVGEGGVPLVLLMHFRGNLDYWDPALIDALAEGRRVIAFDNTGVGGSSGTTPSTVAQMALDAISFLDALDLARADVLGFSLGSFVAQEIALIRPVLVRRLVLASAAHQGAPGMHGWAQWVIESVASRRSSRKGARRLLHPLAREPVGRREGHGTDVLPGRTGCAHHVADAPGTVRRGVRLGHPQLPALGAGDHDPGTGVRHQR